MAFIPNPADVPQSLRDRPQWVLWRYEARGDDKPTKVPYQVRNPKWKASSTNPDTWGTFAAACAACSAANLDGIGYTFSSDDPYVGIDLDDILDDQGNCKPWAAPWLAELSTYAEVSPSGKGIKAIAIGKLPGGGINAGDIELYDQGRYFTITGQRLTNAPAEPCDLNGTIDRLYALAQQKKAQREQLAEYAKREKYAQAAFEGELERVRNAPQGTRNDALNRAAFALATFLESGLLDEATIADALADAAQIAGLGAAEIRATLRSGLRAGSAHPRQLTTTHKAIRGDVVPATGEIIDSSDWWHEGITLDQLQHKHFEPLRWIIEDICPEGVTLVAAKPKAKKSWLALGAALAIAMGGKALGRLSVAQGRVLFLDLEGNQRRIKSRIQAILGNSNIPWPANFEVRTGWARGEECVTRLEQYFLGYPDTRCVVIDLLAEVRPPMDPRANQYDYDRELLVHLNRLAEKYGVAIIVIHHTRKAKGDDVFDEVSGTLGINGAVSTLWILSRQPDGHVVLHFTGRDLVKDEPLALQWDAFLCGFVIEGSAEEVSVSNERRTILDLMDDDEAWTPKQLAVELGKSVGAVQQLLRDMLAEGQIDKSGYGKYSKIPSKSGKSSKSSTSSKSGKSQTDEASTLTDQSNSYSTLTTTKVRVETHTDAPNSPDQSNSYHSYQVSLEGRFRLVSLDSVPSEDITDSMPADWSSSADDIVIVHDPARETKPWVVVVAPTGRRLASAKTIEEAQRLAVPYA